LRDLNDWRRIRDDLQGTAMDDMFGVQPTVTFFEAACELRYTAFAVGLGFSSSACSLT
jgi:hypothetical protein